MKLINWIVQDDIRPEIERLRGHLSGTQKRGPICRWGLAILDSRQSVFGSVSIDANCDWSEIIDGTFGKYLAATKRIQQPVSVSVLLPGHWGIHEGEKEASARRAEILRSGAMIGVLGPDCHLTSVKHADKRCRPFRSPDNWLNIRTAIPDDIAFVDINPGLRKILQYVTRNSDSTLSP